MYLVVYCRIIHNIQKIEATKYSPTDDGKTKCGTPIQWNSIQPFGIDTPTTWMNLKNISLNERSQFQKTIYYIIPVTPIEKE